MKKDEIVKIIKRLNSEYPIIFLYVIGNFFNAILLRLFTTGHFVLRSVFFDMAFIILLTSVSFVVKKKRRHLYYAITSFIMVFICVANSLYYNYYLSFISVSLLATSVFVKDVGDAIVDMVVRACDLSYLWILVVMFIFFKRKQEKEDINKNYLKKGLILVFIMMAIGSSLPPYNSFSRLYKLWNRVAVVNSFGPYVYQVDDIIQSLN